jgi:hypothetical protein
MGARKHRCYNRGNDRFLCFDQSFQRENTKWDAPKRGGAACPAKTVFKKTALNEDHLVRIIE